MSVCARFGVSLYVSAVRHIYVVNLSDLTASTVVYLLLDSSGSSLLFSSEVSIEDTEEATEETRGK